MVETIRRSLVKLFWWLGGAVSLPSGRGWRVSTKRNDLDFK